MDKVHTMKKDISIQDVVGYIYVLYFRIQKTAKRSNSHPI
jgi:hypothetical protein